MDGLVVCGGSGFDGLNQYLTTTCLSFVFGQWMPSHSLDQDRDGHTSWMSEEGLVLMGGVNPLKAGITSEILQSNGDSVPYFHMKYDTW